VERDALERAEWERQRKDAEARAAAKRLAELRRPELDAEREEHFRRNEEWWAKREREFLLELEDLIEEPAAVQALRAWLKEKTGNAPAQAGATTGAA
jgi:hypothetical protein